MAVKASGNPLWIVPTPFTAPAADQLGHDSRCPCTEPASLTKRKIEHEVEHHAVAHIEAAQRPLLVEIVGLVAGRRRARPGLQPCRQRLRVGHVLRVRVMAAHEAAGAEALLGSERQRVVAARAEVAGAIGRRVLRERREQQLPLQRSAWTTRLRGSTRQTDSSPAAAGRRRSTYPAGSRRSPAAPAG